MNTMRYLCSLFGASMDDLVTAETPAGFLFCGNILFSYILCISINILKFASLLYSSDYETLQIEQTNTETDNDLPIMSLTLRLYLDCNPSQAMLLLNKNQYSLYNDYWHSDLPGD